MRGHQARLRRRRPTRRPLVLTLLAPGGRVRTWRVPVWAHGLPRIPDENAVTALAFSNALRVFYSFVYRPRNDLRREHEGREYFVRQLHFDYGEAPLFGPWLFRPTVRLVQLLSERVRRTLQNGSLNAYLAYIGILLLIVLAGVFYL